MNKCQTAKTTAKRGRPMIGKTPTVKVTAEFSKSEATWLRKQANKREDNKSVSAVIRSMIHSSNKSFDKLPAPRNAIKTSITVTESNARRLMDISEYSGISVIDAIRGIVHDGLSGKR